jgi:YidC/Oxa1 family membrane protein insertase
MGCLPLLLQAPIFIAIFRILLDPDRVINGTLISETTFYVFSPLGEVARVHVWGWLLIVLMAGSMFVAQKQMMAKNPATEGIMAQQQKIMLYGMPLFLGVFGMNFPIGVLLYWVTTNMWQMAQQALILRAVKTDAAEDEDKPGKKAEAQQDGKKPKGAPPVPKGTGSRPRSKRDSKPGKKPKGPAPRKPEPTKPADPGGDGSRPKSGGDGSRPKDDKPRPKGTGHLPPRRRGKRDS